MDGRRVEVIRMEGTGAPEVLRHALVHAREPSPQEVRVRVRVSGVNRADLLQRRGGYPAPPGVPPDVPGLEYAGTVEAVGGEVALWRPGDRVMGIVGGGGYARELVVHERAAVRQPAGADPVEAGAIPEVFLTAWDALSLHAGLRAGETLLVHAVGSGVGTAALQWARAAGARVLGTSRTPGKLERARALGLEMGIATGPDASPWDEQVLEATAGRGVDVVLDLVGGPYLAGNLRVLREGGRMVVVGVTGGREAPLDLRLLMARRATLIGTVMRSRPLEERATLARAFEAEVVPLFERGLLRPVVDRVFPALDAAEAHRLLESNDTFGKVLLDWGE